MQRLEQLNLKVVLIVKAVIVLKIQLQPLLSKQPSSSTAPIAAPASSSMLVHDSSIMNDTTTIKHGQQAKSQSLLLFIISKLIIIIYIKVTVNNHQSWFIRLQHLQIKCKLNIRNMFFYIQYCLEVIYKF